MPQTDAAKVTVSTQRLLSATLREVFAAFEQPERLAVWWGPNGFTNTFHRFDFKPGGQWVYVMHRSNGANYPNESIFREIESDRRIVIEHMVKPWYKLTVTLTPSGEGTLLSWVQECDSAEVGQKMRDFIATANEENLDRLESLLASAPPVS